MNNGPKQAPVSNPVRWLIEFVVVSRNVNARRINKIITKRRISFFLVG